MQIQRSRRLCPHHAPRDRFPPRSALAATVNLHQRLRWCLLPALRCLRRLDPGVQFPRPAAIPHQRHQRQLAVPVGHARACPLHRAPEGESVRPHGAPRHRRIRGLLDGKGEVVPGGHGPGGQREGDDYP